MGFGIMHKYNRDSCDKILLLTWQVQIKSNLEHNYASLCEHIKRNDTLKFKSTTSFVSKHSFVSN